MALEQANFATVPSSTPQQTTYIRDYPINQVYCSLHQKRCRQLLRAQVNPLLILCLKKFGTSPQAAVSLAKTWEHTIHRVKTKYGVSKSSYQNTSDALIFGPGQGSSLGPFLWLLCFILMVPSLSPTAPGLHHTSADGTRELQHFGDSFVDDTALPPLA
jgi:hypothetical protein